MRSLTEMQGYLSMIKFLELYFKETGSDDVGSLLSSMQINLHDGTSMDSAMYIEWLECVEEVLKEQAIN